MKVKGQDLIDFFKTWPQWGDVYMEDVPFSEREEDNTLCTEDEDGNSSLIVDPAETYTVDYGVLGWQGTDPEPPDFDSDFVRVLRKWLKAKTTATLVVEVPKGEKDAATALLKERGWKVRT